MSMTVVEQLSMVRVSIAESGRSRRAVMSPFIEPPWPTRTTSPDFAGSAISDSVIHLRARTGRFERCSPPGGSASSTWPFRLEV